MYNYDKIQSIIALTVFRISPKVKKYTIINSDSNSSGKIPANCKLFISYFRMSGLSRSDKIIAGHKLQWENPPLLQQNIKLVFIYYENNKAIKNA